MKDREEARKPTESSGGVRPIEIMGTLDRHAAEALQLEIRRLAKRHRIDLKEIRMGVGADDVSV